VLKWTLRGNLLLFFPSRAQAKTPADFDAVFANGAEIFVSYFQRDVPVEDNRAVSVVYGTTAGGFLRYGFGATDRRDTNVFSQVYQKVVAPGESYYFRKYILADRFVDIGAHSREWTGETLDGRIREVCKLTMLYYYFIILLCYYCYRLLLLLFITIIYIPLLFIIVYYYYYYITITITIILLLLSLLNYRIY
jgi:hypothetical protein